jgi:hypothetical protein
MTGRRRSDAAQLRKLLRRELRRVGASGLSLYVDGPRGVIRVTSRDDGRRRHAVPTDEALALLRALPDGAGVEAALSAFAAAP